MTDRDGLLTSAFLSLKQKYVSLVFVYLLYSDLLCFFCIFGKKFQIISKIGFRQPSAAKDLPGSSGDDHFYRTHVHMGSDHWVAMSNMFLT